jgi:sodium/bile acid cotransporter 7
MQRVLTALRPDPFTLALLGTVAIASLFPVTGPAVGFLDNGVKAAVMLLFFLHGARLPREAVLQALAHWRLHLVVFAVTFLLFPLLGWASAPLAAQVLDASLVYGMLFLCCLPSTVQSSIAFTSMAQGNIPAAACSASASNLLGIFITPLLTGLLLARHGEVSFGAVGSIATLLFLPFVIGQVLRGVVARWVSERRTLLTLVDQGSILLMIYAAFSKAVIAGIWSRLSAADLAVLAIACTLLLAVVVMLAVFVARRLRFSKEDEITIVFCGSMKSLVTGVPIANVLFPGAQAGVIVLPLMIFHQIQLLFCAVLARRYGRRRVESASATALREVEQ